MTQPVHKIDVRRDAPALWSRPIMEFVSNDRATSTTLRRMNLLYQGEWSLPVTSIDTRDE